MKEISDSFSLFSSSIVAFFLGLTEICKPSPNVQNIFNLFNLKVFQVV